MAALLTGCRSESTGSSTFDGRILIIGAGPAGMTAAHLLAQRGVEFAVLEAGPTHGGRIRHNLDFVDFPISLGAEWVHVSGSILGQIVNDDDVAVDTELVGYGDDDEVAYIGDQDTYLGPLEPDVFDGDLKFRSSSWLDFYNRYVLPGVADAIRYDTRIVQVDHSGDGVVLTDAAGNTYDGDRVIVTAPLRILQLRQISFTPPIDQERLAVIDGATVWSGFKAFFEFSDKFYPAAIAPADSETLSGQRLFYDAAYGQPTAHHVLGLFSVGAQAERYQALSDVELQADVLGELDAAFDGAATSSYVRHLAQSWNDEPFARAAYLEDFADSDITRALAEPLTGPSGELVHFAGDAYTRFDDWSSVHTAARSAIDTVRRILG